MDLNSQNIKLSILILTHNRPLLFKRAIESVINLPNIEILVNNDSCDIDEIILPYIKYFYKTSNDLSDIYNFLISKSSGEYLYFLEDDDYCTSNMNKYEEFLTEDIVYCPFIPDNSFYNYLKHFKNFPNKVIDNIDLHKTLDHKLIFKFQLSQIIFKKSSVSMLMSGNYLDNDYKFFKNLRGKVRMLNKPIFIQTTDGKDNISYKQYCKDKRFKDQHV